ncbi:SDR family NAD(P)-dependent oxidoreductase [Pedosphaera parvula]|uniref:Short-chain dehydrogenase/reductase SDR n=1 Tax=Pedosphaera parvula (strain Ellin514) TaxID=320771 RepID=B9XFU1_PEDPL|nr:SDR family oxidoreductase [Pedosphaera parvula]EEF61455.1 short-chain dehydrogenase/reductase SDR [Pedosphaera parvula Ellin514]
MDMRLKGKVAIVTGAAHGIGRGIAEVFAEEGAAVFMVDLDAGAGEAFAAELRHKGQDVTFMRADVSSPAEVARVVEMAGTPDKGIDVLCNNAAYIGQWHNALEATEEEWQKSLSVTLMGTQYFTKEVLPFMVRQKGGSIINISSVQGMVGGRNSVAYTTVKSGLLGLTRNVAYDFGPHNIRVNVICPGAITTRISPPVGSELYERQISKTFLGRVGQPREVGKAALFLASDESSYITGAVIPVDGGWTAM